MCLRWKTPMIGYFHIMTCDTSQSNWDTELKALVINKRAKFYPLEASATHDKVARSISSLVMFQYFYTRHTIVIICRADFGIAKGTDVLQTNLNYISRLTQTIPLQATTANTETKVLLLNFYIFMMLNRSKLFLHFCARLICIYIHYYTWFILFENKYSWYTTLFR